MNLALILGLCLWSASSSLPALRGPGLQTTAQAPATASPDSSQSQGNSASQAQTPPSQGAPPTQPAPSPTAQTPNSPAKTKPTPAHPRRKKAIPPNCSNAPTALNTAVGKPGDIANSTASGSANAGSKNANAAPLKPCPPPKKVVRNGGSSEPKVQLSGDTPAEQASDKSSTEQLAAATQANLKKAAGLQLNSSQREMVNQIREFMAQSKAAVAAGDLEGAHNLAVKAHLLSVELVKP